MKLLLEKLKNFFLVYFEKMVRMEKWNKSKILKFKIIDNFKVEIFGDELHDKSWYLKLFDDN